MVDVKEEIKYRLKIIVEVLVFLLVATWFWYGPRQAIQQNAQQARTSLAYMQGVEITTSENMAITNESRVGEYHFTLENSSSEKKNVLVSLALDHQQMEHSKCKRIDYNEIGYYLMEKNEEDYYKRYLAMDGRILLVTLEPGAVKDYTLTYFVDANLDLNKQQFYGYAFVSDGQNI